MLDLKELALIKIVNGRYTIRHYFFAVVATCTGETTTIRIAEDAQSKNVVNLIIIKDIALDTLTS